MPLITRISRAFKADIHAVLDCIEEPVSLLKQAVRDMADTVLKDQQRLKQLDKNKYQHDIIEQEYQQQLSVINEEIEVSFDADHHDLARKAIKRKLELQKAIKLLAKQQQSTVNVINELQQRLKENQQKLNAMRQKQEVLVDTYTENPSDIQLQDTEITVTDDEVEIAFLKQKRARTSS